MESLLVLVANGKAEWSRPALCAVVAGFGRVVGFIDCRLTIVDVVRGMFQVCSMKGMFTASRD